VVLTELRRVILNKVRQVILTSFGPPITLTVNDKRRQAWGYETEATRRITACGKISRDLATS
jgi:hypothetical protein